MSDFPAMEEATNTRGTSPQPSESASTPDLLALAETDPQAVVDHMRDEWDRSWEDIKNLNEQWIVNLARSEGYLGARLEKVQDRQQAWIPEGIQPSIVGLDKATRLAARLRTAIFADPPEPSVVPSRGTDVSADNAEFQGRILKDESRQMDYAVRAGDAFDTGRNFGSGFLHFYIDPQGRGPEPVQIKAHPDAIDANDPLTPPVDEATGMPAGPKAPVLKYVTADGQLTAERYGQPLKRQFLPKICCEVLNGRHCRLLPGTSNDVGDAQGLLVGAMVPLGMVKAAYPSVAQMPDDELSALVSYRPGKAKDLLPVSQRRLLNNTKVSDSSLVFLLLRYSLPTAQNEKGSYFAAIGDTHLAYYGVWWDEEHDERLDLPAAQFKQYHEPGNAYGAGSMQKLGPGTEILALILDAMLMHMDRFGDQKTFVPMNSSLRPEQLEAESHRYIPFAGGAPVQENIPDFPITFEKMYARIASEMDDESGLQQTGQGLQSANITSAVQFSTNLQQVQVLLSDLRQNTGRGLERGWKVMSQLQRAFYTIPQLLRWAGEDGAYHVKEWSGEDMIGIADVEIAPGTFSGQTPQQKAALAQGLYLNDKILTAQEYRRIVMGQFDATLSLQEDPHFQRIKSQLDRWLEGPPAGWQPPPTPAPQLPGMPPQPPPPPDPVLASIWAPRPVDNEPQVAKMRLEEIGRVLAQTSRMNRFPAEWQAALEQTYEATRKMAGVFTIPEQQQMQAQAASGEQQAKQADTQAKIVKAQAETTKAGTDLQISQLEAQIKTEELQLKANEQRLALLLGGRTAPAGMP